MGTLVNHHAPRPVAEPAALHHPRPREHHAAAVPRLAQPRLPPLQLPSALQRRRSLPEIVARVDEHRLQPVEELVGHPEHDQPGLSCDRHTHLVVDVHAAAALEALLREKHRHPRPEPLPLLFCEPLQLPHVVGEDLIPRRRPRPLPDHATSSGPQPAEHGDHREQKPTAPWRLSLGLQGQRHPPEKKIQCQDQAAGGNGEERQQQHRRVDVHRRAAGVWLGIVDHGIWNGSEAGGRPRISPGDQALSRVVTLSPRWTMPREYSLTSTATARSGFTLFTIARPRYSSLR